jgi:ketosteroid isomerase-like protein
VVDERLTLRFPRLARVVRAAVLGLPPKSRLRQAIVRRGIRINAEAYNRRDIDAFLAPLDPRAEVDLIGQLEGAAVEDRYEGREGVMEFLRALDEVWEAPRFEPRELIDFGDRYLLLINSRGRGRASRVLGEHPFAMLLTWRRGMAVRAEYYWYQDQALEAVGLRPD